MYLVYRCVKEIFAIVQKNRRFSHFRRAFAVPAGLPALFPGHRLRCMARKNPLSPEEADVGKRLRFLREDHGLGRTRFCRKVGISESSLRNYEAGKTILPASVGERICRLFDVSPLWLGLALGDESEIDVVKFRSAHGINVDNYNSFTAFAYAYLFDFDNAGLQHESMDTIKEIMVETINDLMYKDNESTKIFFAILQNCIEIIEVLNDHALNEMNKDMTRALLKAIDSRMRSYPVSHKAPPPPQEPEK